MATVNGLGESLKIFFTLFWRDGSSSEPELLEVSPCFIQFEME